MTTQERMLSYYAFDEAVLDAVSEAATQQNTKSFNELATQYGLEDGPTRLYPMDNSEKWPIDVLQFTPTQDYDPAVMRVLHLPMANPVSKNKTMQAMRLFAADPSEQLLVVGNPSSPGRNAGRVTFEGAKTIIWHTNLGPLVEPLMSYLDQENISRVTNLGYSYGAEKAATATGIAWAYGMEARQMVLAEPISVIERSLAKLGLAFLRSGNKLQEYIAQSESEPYTAIRKEENVFGTIAYTLGMLRLTNLAISAALADEGFQSRVKGALNLHPGLRTAIAWGTASELTNNAQMIRIISELKESRASYPSRISAMPLEGMHHAGGDDIDLHAAIMLQGLANTSR